MTSYNIYQLVGVPKDSSPEVVRERIDKYKRLVGNTPTDGERRILKEMEDKYEELLYRVNEFREASPFARLVNERNREVNRRYKVERNQNNKKKQTKNFKLRPMFTKVVAGVLVVVCAFGASKAVSNHMDKENQKYNVCVEYEVQEGDTKDKLNDLFKEYGFSYYEVSGAYRDVDFVYAGDVVIGRTTKEKADELAAAGLGTIISIDEAVALLGENNSLAGEFKAYANAKSDVTFFVPEGKVII